VPDQHFWIATPTSNGDGAAPPRFRSAGMRLPAGKFPESLRIRLIRLSPRSCSTAHGASSPDSFSSSRGSPFLVQARAAPAGGRQRRRTPRRLAQRLPNTRHFALRQGSQALLALPTTTSRATPSKREVSSRCREHLLRKRREVQLSRRNTAMISPRPALAASNHSLTLTSSPAHASSELSPPTGARLELKRILHRPLLRQVSTATERRLPLQGSYSAQPRRTRTRCLVVRR
jgi:hypothetical protein